MTDSLLKTILYKLGSFLKRFLFDVSVTGSIFLIATLILTQIATPLTDFLYTFTPDTVVYSFYVIYFSSVGVLAYLLTVKPARRMFYGGLFSGGVYLLTLWILSPVHFNIISTYVNPVAVPGVIVLAIAYSIGSIFGKKFFTKYVPQVPYIDMFNSDENSSGATENEAEN